MKSFFANLNFPRAVILFCLLGSMVLGWLVFQRSRRLGEVEDELARVENLLREIQIDAYRLNDLQQLYAKQKFKGQDSAETYIRDIAADDLTKIGQVDIVPRRQVPTAEFEDQIYTIKPMEKTQDFSRSMIGNFFFKLESDSGRLKVTSIHLEPSEKLKAGEIGKDRWTFEAAVTSRSKIEKKAPGA